MQLNLRQLWMLLVVLLVTGSYVQAVPFLEPFESDVLGSDGRDTFEIQPEFVPLEHQRPGQEQTRKAASKPFDVDVITTDVNGGNQGEAGVSHLPGVFFRQSYPFFGTDLFNSFAGFGIGGIGGSPQEWWKGPNVCVEKAEEEEVDRTIQKKPVEKKEDAEENGDSDVEEIIRPLFGDFQFSLNSCIEKPNKYVCTKVLNKNGKKKTQTITHQCCYGYARPRNAGFNAPCEKFEIKSVEETANELGTKEFIDNGKSNGLNDLLAETKNVTIFMPVDSALNKYNDQTQNNVVEPSQQSFYLRHLVNGEVSLYDASNEQVLQTKEDGQTIRINSYQVPYSLGDEPFQYTANCVPIVKHDKLTSEGLVHSLKGVLTPVKKTVMDLIRERPDMSIMRTVLETTQLSKLLEGNKPMTIFAPTDDAFDKVEPHLRRALKEGKGCASNILKNHMLDLTFCSVASIAGAKTTAYNLLGEALRFNRSKSEDKDVLKPVRINDEAIILDADIMGTNGVLHVIDTILPTESALPMSTLMQEKNVTLFQSLLEASGLDTSFDDLQNITVIAPTDAALRQTKWAKLLDEAPEQLKGNNELQEFLNYHVVRPMIKTCDLSDKKLETLSGSKVRVNIYSTHALFPNVMNRATINCARLVHFDDESCGSVLHQVDKVLTPPTMNLLEQLESNPNYSHFLELVRAANLSNILAEDTKQGFTLLIPKNEVFEEVNDWEKTLTKDPQELENLIKTHIVSDVVCCAGIVPTQWPFVRSVESLNGAHLRITRDRRPKIENAGISKCDNLATNGIIHEINDVIVPKRKQPVQSQQFEQFFI